MYLNFARILASQSHATRLKVGAVFVSPDGVMSTGINGMPAGGTNECEIKLYPKFQDNDTHIEYPFIDTENGRQYKLVTKSEVSHAEEALFSKLIKQGVSTKGGRIFITHSPCINCAKIIAGSGVTHVHYLNDYRSLDGVVWLMQNDVEVIKEQDAVI